MDPSALYASFMDNIHVETRLTESKLETIGLITLIYLGYRLLSDVVVPFLLFCCRPRAPAVTVHLEKEEREAVLEGYPKFDPLRSRLRTS